MTLKIIISVHHKSSPALAQMWASYEPVRISWNDDAARSTLVPYVLPPTGWISSFSTSSRQHAWHSCQDVVSDDTQGVVTRPVHSNIKGYDHEQFKTSPSHSKLPCQWKKKWHHLWRSWRSTLCDTVITSNIQYLMLARECRREFQYVTRICWTPEGFSGWD